MEIGRIGVWTFEFEQHPWVPIHIGPIDLSITKAVAYLILGSLLTMALGVFLMRVKLALTPGPRQALTRPQAPAAGLDCPAWRSSRAQGDVPTSGWTRSTRRRTPSPRLSPGGTPRRPEPARREQPFAPVESNAWRRPIASSSRGLARTTSRASTWSCRAMR